MAKVWMPDHPPASAGAYDDEFDNSSFDTGSWAEWDVPNDLTVSENDYGLSLLKASSANTYFSGVYRTAPNNDWTIWAKISLTVKRVANSAVLCGLFLGQDLANNPSTSDIVAFRYGYNAYSSGDSIDANKFSSYQNDGASSYGNVADVIIGSHVYQRIRRASNTLYFDFSTNGIGWQQIGSSAEPFVPAQFGFAIFNLTTGVDARMTCSFFRYVGATPALTDVPNGKRVM